MKKAYIIAGIAVILTAIMVAFPPQAESGDRENYRSATGLLRRYA